MRLPGVERAVVDRAKIRDYLLSMEHPIGRFKAAFFCALGYSRGEWERLREDLLEVARTGVAVEGRRNVFGQMYEVRGMLVGPSGRRANITTVWIIVHGDDSPQLVTAFPGEGR